jgi:hypothetical protein
MSEGVLQQHGRSQSEPSDYLSQIAFPYYTNFSTINLELAERNGIDEFRLQPVLKLSGEIQIDDDAPKQAVSG